MDPLSDQLYINTNRPIPKLIYYMFVACISILWLYIYSTKLCQGKCIIEYIEIFSVYILERRGGAVGWGVRPASGRLSARIPVAIDLSRKTR